MSNPHGGKRAGAGRPAHDEKPIPVTVTLPPSVIAKLKKIDPNLSAAIRTITERNATMTIDEIRIVPIPGGIAVEWYENGTVVKSKTYAEDEKTKAENAAYRAGVTHRCPVGDWTEAE